MITEDVKLSQGVLYNGTAHTFVTMRASTIGDSIAAEKKAEGRGLIILSLAILAEQIIALGDIPKEKITADLLAHLCDEDFERLQEVREFLKKKARWLPVA